MELTPVKVTTSVKVRVAASLATMAVRAKHTHAKAKTLVKTKRLAKTKLHAKTKHLAKIKRHAKTKRLVKIKHLAKTRSELSRQLAELNLQSEADWLLIKKCRVAETPFVCVNASAFFIILGVSTLASGDHI